VRRKINNEKKIYVLQIAIATVEETTKKEDYVKGGDLNKTGRR